MKSLVFPVMLSVFLVTAMCFSCNRDDLPEIVPPDNVTGNEKSILFRHDKDDGTMYRINQIGAGFGTQLSSGGELGGWDYMGFVEAGHHWVVMHDPDKQFAIRQLYSTGEMGPETDRQTWGSNYETFFGFHVGNNGFVFGQDSYGDHRWFVQRIGSDGRLATNEASHGTWNNYYGAATPVYVNGETYLFFQTDDSDNFWFITHVDSNGNLEDCDSGYWGDFWPRVTSYESNGKAYIVGEYHSGGSQGSIWFIQRVNADGTMGEETDRGTWRNFYHTLTSFVSNGQAYICGGAGSSEYNAMNFFIQEVTADGKMGAETSHFAQDRDYDHILPFRILDKPGSFRYIIGWDLSSATAVPSRPWSSLFTDAWSGETKFGGGAALTQIDLDPPLKLDAVLAGIQSLPGPDRYYYKVAWNLDATGRAASWSQTLFGPFLGEIQAGGGADVADIDGNGIPDLLLMYVDDPGGDNSFRYNIGWNLDKNGVAESWSNMIQVSALGSFDSGGGAAIADIDGNGRPDVVLMAIDNPDQENRYWFTIGKNLDKNGIAQSWLPKIVVPVNLYWNSAGGGAALADINNNNLPDLILTNLDSRQGYNEFWCHVGWDLNINGQVTGWSEFKGPQPGWITEGAGTAIGDIDKNGILDMLFMAIDNPYGSD